MVNIASTSLLFLRFGCFYGFASLFFSCARQRVESTLWTCGLGEGRTSMSYVVPLLSPLSFV